MPYVSVGDSRLHVIESGSGEALFLLHGNAGSGAVWQNVIPGLARHFRVFAHDRAGFGQSDETKSEDLGPQDYADELRDLMAATGISRAHICGISFGGMVAQCFALKYPEQVSRLVLVGTTADRTGRSVPQSLAELDRDGWPVVADRLVKSWFRPQSDPKDVSEAYAIALQSSQRMRALTLTALGRFDIRDRIHRIAAPTLVVVGQQDQTCPLSMSETVHREIAGSRLIQIPDCAHLVPVEQPGAFIEAVLPFLGSSEQGPGDQTP
tara:strand:+ start:2151 stop:2948 length:798 start_codon:yes stop_codon:yes gene_type:complete